MERRKNRMEVGSTLIEFAITASIFLFILFAIIEFSLLYWANLSMQHAVREGARYAITGQTANGLDRRESVIQHIREQSMGMYDRVSPKIVTTIDGIPYVNPDPSRPPAGIFGSSGNVIVLQLDCTWSLLTPIFKPLFTDGKHRFSVAATMRNESF